MNTLYTWRRCTTFSKTNTSFGLLILKTTTHPASHPPTTHTASSPAQRLPLFPFYTTYYSDSDRINNIIKIAQTSIDMKTLGLVTSQTIWVFIFWLREEESVFSLSSKVTKGIIPQLLKLLFLINLSQPCCRLLQAPSCTPLCFTFENILFSSASVVMRLTDELV